MRGCGHKSVLLNSGEMIHVFMAAAPYGMGAGVETPLLFPSVVIPAEAGMDYLNHWIPACAGMTAWARMTAKIAPMCLFLCGHSSPVLPFPPPAVIPAKAGIQETRPRRLIRAEFLRMERSVVVPLVVIPALREWII